MTFEEFVNSPQIKKAMSSNNPLGELERMFGNNPLAKNAINMARRMPNNKELEKLANNICQEVHLDMNNLNAKTNR